MTQDKDPSQRSGASKPEVSATQKQSEKPKRAPRKTAAKATEKPAKEAVKSESAAKPAKKSAAKPSTKKAASASATKAETPASDDSVKKTTTPKARPATAKKTPASRTKKTAPDKTSVKKAEPQTESKAASAPEKKAESKPAAKPETKSEAETPAKKSTDSAKKPSRQPRSKAAAPAKVTEDASAKSAPAVSPVASSAPASPAPVSQPAESGENAGSGKERTSSRSRSRGRRGGAAKNAQKREQAVAGQDAATGSVAERAPVQDVPAESAPVQESAASGEAAPSDKPRSRRSRRGGRRRNKSRNAENAANGQNAATTNGEAAASSVDPESSVAPAARPAPENATPEKFSEDLSHDADEHDEDSGISATSGGRQSKGRGAKEAKTAEEPKSAGKRRMFISVLSGELVEVVLTEGNTVVEYYIEMLHQAKVKGNIYKGVVSNIDANLQAAFISYAGGVKNGFLQIDEVHPEYYLTAHDSSKRKYPLIQKVLKPGQEILVQVVKEPAGTKGAFLTSYLSLPGRFIVLTPGREQIGVSRKVDDDGERTRLRGMLEGLKPGKGLGVIVRTVSEGASKTSLQRDLQFLKRLWKDVRAKGKDMPAPSLIYQELDLSTRAVRDYLTDDVDEVWVDDAVTGEQVTEFANLLFPRKKDLVQVHKDAGQSLFERFGVQKQLDSIHSREVVLPSGGRLVFDNTEALTAIDINSGRSSGKNNFEDMAYRTNIEAARMIPLQLRLRDIGGQVVADFIEMRDRNHWREVEKTVAQGMKGDRARYDVGKLGPFGMLEIVRQRLGSSAISISTEPCPCCKGTGIRRNLEWQAMQSLREINRQIRAAGANNQPSMTYHAESELAFYLLNTKRSILETLERETGVSVIVKPQGV